MNEEYKGKETILKDLAKLNLEELGELMIDIERIKIQKEYKGKETKYKCPHCNRVIHKEICKEIDYPFVCLNCDENMYSFEVVK